MRVAVRRATEADAEAVVAMHLKAHRETYGALLPEAAFAAREATKSERVARWRQIIADARDFWVATDDAGVVGFIIVGDTRGEGALRPRETELQSIYTLQRSYGTGAGKALVDAALGTAPAVVWLLEDNPRAMAFYRKLGFELNGNRQQLPAEWHGLWEVQMQR